VTILVLLLILVVMLVLRALVGRSVRQHEAQIGLERRTIVAADDSRIGVPTLRSARYRLVGRPDHLVISGGVIIPVEQKPHSRQLRYSHVLQLAAQCLLVQEVYGQRPPYGIVVLAGGRQQQIAFTPELERRLVATMKEMRGILARHQEPGRCWVQAKCTVCGFQRICWGSYPT
jgi:CRISPR-associated exonuclease Cas4